MPLGRIGALSRHSKAVFYQEFRQSILISQLKYSLDHLFVPRLFSLTVKDGLHCSGFLKKQSPEVTSRVQGRREEL